MRVSIAAAARRFGVEPTEAAVSAALAGADDEAEHDAYMAQHFPGVIRASMNANRERERMVEFDRRAREDPMAIPGTPPVVTISPGSRGVAVVTPLPGLGAPASSKPGEVRAPGRSMFGHN
jgi:hypothetical protein